MATLILKPFFAFGIFSCFVFFIVLTTALGKIQLLCEKEFKAKAYANLSKTCQKVEPIYEDADMNYTYCRNHTHIFYLWTFCLCAGFVDNRTSRVCKSINCTGYAETMCMSGGAFNQDELNCHCSSKGSRTICQKYYRKCEKSKSPEFKWKRSISPKSCDVSLLTCNLATTKYTLSCGKPQPEPQGAQTLTIKMQMFEGSEHYVHTGGHDFLKCIVDNKDLVGNLEWYKNGRKINTGEDSLEKQEHLLQVKVDSADRSDRTYTCKLVVAGKTKSEKTTKVKITGTIDDDVFMKSSVEGTVIKDAISSVTIVCRTGGTINQMFSDPLMISHNEDTLYENGKMEDAVQKYNLTFLGFGGYDTFNVYGGVRFNDVSQVIGTIKCSRRKYFKEIVYTDKEDVGNIDMDLFKNCTILGSLRREANKNAPGVKTLTTLPIGKFTFACTATGGYPASIVKLMKNGNPVKADTNGMRHQATIDLTTTDQYLACSVQVPGMKTHVMKFKIDVVEDPLPVNCTTISQKLSLVRSCTVGSETSSTSCSKVLYKVNWSKSGKTSSLGSHDKKDNMKMTCAVHKTNQLKIDIIVSNSDEGRTFVLYYDGQKKRERLNEFDLKPYTGGQDDGKGNAAQLIPFGKIVLPILASVAFFMFSKI